MGECLNLGQIKYALWSHAAENDGGFPGDFSDIGPSLIDGPASQFKHPKTKRGEDWIYFGGFTWDDPGATILMASPTTFSRSDGTRMVGEGEFRMVLSLDGRVVFLKEADYQSCLAEQHEPAWRKREEVPEKESWAFLSNPIWKKWERSVLERELREASVPRPVPSEVIPGLLDALGDSDSGYDAAGVLAVMSLQNDSVVPGLVDVVRRDRGKARYWATVSLEEIGLRNAVTAIPLMIQGLGTDGDLPVSAAKALAGAGPLAVDAVPQLIRLAENGDSWERKCAVIALGRAGPGAQQALPVLNGMLDSEQEYRIDVARALWKIDFANAGKVIPVLIEELEGQRNPKGTNHRIDNDFFSAMELLGEIGPKANTAIPILEANLKGGARQAAAWALWRIDPSYSETVTLQMTGYLESSICEEDRLDRLSGKSGNLWASVKPAGKEVFHGALDTRMAALGALWHMHPERREELIPVLIALLHEWETAKVLKKLTADTRSAIPALESLAEDESSDLELKLLAREALQTIRGTDPGRW